MLAFDLEATSLDLEHGGLPYSMQICHDDGTTHYAHWPVDPFTRLPLILPTDLEFFAEQLTDAEFCGHNIKYDMLGFEKAWEYVFRRPIPFKWNWDLIHDTCIKAHAWRNLWPHGLKDLRSILLHVSRRRQDSLKHATDAARKICRTKEFIAAHGEWRIAAESDPHWPGIKRAPKERDDEVEGWWLFDTWLPLEIVLRAPEFLPPESDWLNGGNFFFHPWENVSKLYGLEDVETTLPINTILDDALRREGTSYMSYERHKLLPITYEMQRQGVSLIADKLDSEIIRYEGEGQRLHTIIQQIASEEAIWDEKEGFNPDSDKQMRKLLYDKWQLPILKMTDPSKTFPEGQPSTDAETIKSLVSLLTDSPPPQVRDIPKCIDFLGQFVHRKRNEKACEQVVSYKNWSTRRNPVSGLCVFPSINITGTRFTRQSYSQPNLQQASTGKVIDEETEEIDFLTRVTLGPRRGREWLSIDFQSIEFFIWGFSCGNAEIRSCYEQGVSPFKPIMEAVWGYFDKGENPPNSVHKKRYKRTKNGIYSILYGAAEGHSDETFGRPGAVRAVIERLPEVKSFTTGLHRDRKRRGYVETLGGCHLYVAANEPHKATSAYVQGHAGWVIGQAMIGCYEYLRDFPDIRILLQIHDELIFEGPVGFHEQHADPLGEIMRASGERFGIPTPVNKKLITSNWGEEIELKAAA